MKKIAFLCSGGVDSTLGMALLKEQGYEVHAFYLKIWLEDELADLQSQCPWQTDIEYVERSCDLLGIDHQIVPLQQEYQKRIISYVIEEARLGRTPNPDLLCNQRIKFGAFIEYINHTGAKYTKIASGHYAGVRQNPEGLYELLCSQDKIKDQSYFLAHIDQSQLARLTFPLHNYTKEQVRMLANKYQLPTAQRKDSQGLCFLGKISFRDFLKAHLGSKEGDFIEAESGQVIGKHSGFWNYTIGQRKGLALSGGPWYVCDKDIKTNRVYISSDYYGGHHKRDSFFASHPHWIAGKAPELSKTHLRVKLRHGPESYDCQITYQDASPSLNLASPQPFLVTIKERDQGIAPGQFAVFYTKDLCLGCATIE